MRKRFLRGLVAIGVLGSSGMLLGCGEEDVDSDAIRTRGMYIDVSTLSRGDGDTQVTVQLRVGGDDGTIVKLTGDDELEATVGDESKVLGAINNRERYRATFGEDAGGTEINVAFTRGEDDDDAPNSEGVIPEPFTLGLDGLSRGDDVQRGTDVGVTWDPAGSGGNVSWSVKGDCIWSESGTTSDDGAFTIAAEDIEVQELDKGEMCDVTITVDRNLSGTIDAAFEEGGRFRTTQRRSINFTSTPHPDETPPEGDGGA